LPKIPLIKPSKKKEEDKEGQFKPWESLLDKKERDKAFNLGHSLDSKKITSALGYLDLKQICYCLAHALNKHIEFSQGFFILGDLREQHRKEQPDPDLKGQDLEFTYNLGDKFRITLDKDKL
jgi:hypothetical protein